MLFDLPCRVLCVGKSQFSGKSSFLLNMLCQDDSRLYKKDFDEIYIFSGSIKSDTKIKNIINVHDIPDENIHENFDEDMLEAIFDLTEEDYTEALDAGEKPKHVCVILDDVSFDGSLKKNSNLLYYGNGEDDIEKSKKLYNRKKNLDILIKKENPIE